MRFLLVLACLLGVSITGAAGQREYVKALRQQVWSTEEGLPQASVHALLQSRDGFIWVGTEAGVARFDGVAFKVFSRANVPEMTSDDVSAITQTADGALLFQTADGVVQLKGARWTRMGDAALQVRAERISGADGTVWERAGNRVSATVRGETTTWVAGAGPSAQQLAGRRVTALTVGADGLAWVGTNAGLAVIFAATGGVAAVPELAGESVLTVMEDAEEDVWVGTETSGLHCLRLPSIAATEGLVGKALTAVVTAGFGSVWVGTRDEGLWRIARGEVAKPVAAGRLTSPVILSLAKGEDGSVWAGTPDGLNHVFADGRVERVTVAEGLPDDFVRVVAGDDGGGVWAGTQHGLAHVVGHSVTIVTAVVTKAEGLGSDVIGALFSVPNAGVKGVWVGTAAGLSFVTAKGQVMKLAGLPGGTVIAMEYGADGLWVATRKGGLSLVRDGVTYEVRDLPLDGDVAGILADTVGGLWLRTSHGVQHVTAAALMSCLGKGGACGGVAISRYGLADGMPSEELVAGGSPVIGMGPQGELLMATRRGLAEMKIAPTPRQPMWARTRSVPVVFERLLVDDAAVTLDGGAVAIPYGRSRLTMEYAGLAFAVPAKTRYRFQLEGFDRDWTEAGTRRTATYTNLPPGSYWFRVQALNGSTVWSEAGAGAELRFQIVPPFYRRWWFWLLMVVVVTLAGVGLYQLRLRRLRAQFDAVLGERNRMAREIHDTLAQDFVGVSVQLDLVTQLLKMDKVAAARTQVERTRELVTAGLAEARRSIWELRANTAADSLPTRLGKVVERYSGAATDVQLGIGGMYRELGERVEGEVLRVAQEALSNVERHAGAVTVRVRLEYGEDMLTLSIVDDGRGFEVEAAARLAGHFGLQGMRERAAVSGGALTLTSAPGDGTTVLLRVPMAKAMGSERG